jgi:hypothetical protein
LIVVESWLSRLVRRIRTRERAERKTRATPMR